MQSGTVKIIYISSGTWCVLVGHPWSTYTQSRRQEEVRWLVLCSAALIPGEDPGLILQEAECTSGPVWTRRNEEKIPTPPTPGIKPGQASTQPSALPLELPGPQKAIFTSVKILMANCVNLGQDARLVIRNNRVQNESVVSLISPG